MKKQFLSLGKALNRAEQKSINGGGPQICTVLCPSYCMCVQDYNDYCVYTSGTRQGEYCESL